MATKMTCTDIRSGRTVTRDKDGKQIAGAPTFVAQFTGTDEGGAKCSATKQGIDPSKFVVGQTYEL